MGDMFFCCFFRFKTFFEGFIKSTKSGEFLATKKHRCWTILLHMVQQWELLTSRSEFGTGCAPPKKWRTLKTFEKLYTAWRIWKALRTWKFLIWFRFQMMFLFNLWGWCALCSFLSKLYLKQPCINLWFDMTRLVLNFGSDYRYTLVSDVIKLFWHKIPGRHWWKTTRCTKTQRLPTEFCGILAGIGFCHARDFAWESHHFLGEGCVCRYLNRVFYMMSTW